MGSASLETLSKCKTNVSNRVHKWNIFEQIILMSLLDLTTKFWFYKLLQTFVTPFTFQNASQYFSQRTGPITFYSTCVFALAKKINFFLFKTQWQISIISTMLQLQFQVFLLSLSFDLLQVLIILKCNCLNTKFCCEEMLIESCFAKH